jgi:hypothetical protein
MHNSLKNGDIVSIVRDPKKIPQLQFVNIKYEGNFLLLKEKARYKKTLKIHSIASGPWERKTTNSNIKFIYNILHIENIFSIEFYSFLFIKFDSERVCKNVC